MSTLKVLSVFGTRPEAVKMAPVVNTLKHTPGIESWVCVTAQHREMLDQVLELFEIEPDVDLNIMRPGQSLASLTANILENLSPILKKIQPDWVLVQGDTTTVMAAALLSYYHQVRIGHVEAGLRTGDKWQPFPEEVNRKIASVLADLHFAPTQHSRENLLREGVPDWRIRVTGNPVIDSLQQITQRPAPPEITRFLEENQIRPGGRRLTLITAHRRENFGEPLEQICQALRSLALRYQNQVHFVYPVHLNPNVKEVAHRMLEGIPNLSLLPPLGYLPMIHLMKHATLVLTDSGGIQEEATAMGIPTLVLRHTTERPEGVAAGVLKLVGTDAQIIQTEAVRLLEDEQAYQAMATAKNPFGDGHAASRIVAALQEFSDSRPESIGETK